METIGAVVVGAGVAGLAVTAIGADWPPGADPGEDTPFGAETSPRNSKVIHAGLYCPTGSHRARLCVRGREWLYRH